MSNSHGLDLTRGNPFPLLVRFAIPLILGTIFQQLYSFADTAIVGRCISADALTAVGVTGSLTFMLLGFTTGSAIGFCIPIAQSVGAEEQEEINRYFWNGLYLCLFIGLLVGVGAHLLVRDLLIAMRTPTQLLDMSVDYLSVILLGLTATVLYNYLGSVLRAFGDAKRPFLFLIFSSILNVLLDFFFILVIPLGVSGVALATVVSQTISVLLCWIWLAKKGTALQAEKSLMALSWKHIKTLCCIGIPLGLEHAVCSIGNVVLQRSINTLGSVAATAQICGEKIRGILTTPMESMGMAMATYAGQNYGARRMDRIKSGIRAGITVQAVYSAVSWIILLILKRPLVGLLLGDLSTPEAASAVQYLTVISVLFVIHGSLMIFRNTIQGMGFGISALASGTMEVVGRSLAGLLAVHFGSFFIVCISAPMAWTLGLICCICLCAWYIPREAKKFASSQR